ncbi:MAG: hypothetical protein KDB14_29165, partial [Planctomycetales bacterium]|nr:hypothetical protein [Planctomycetales bacterium]
MLKTRKQDRANRLRRLRLESLENRRLLAADLAIDVAAEEAVMDYQPIICAGDGVEVVGEVGEILLTEMPPETVAVDTMELESMEMDATTDPSVDSESTELAEVAEDDLSDLAFETTMELAEPVDLAASVATTEDAGNDNDGGLFELDDFQPGMEMSLNADTIHWSNGDMQLDATGFELRISFIGAASTSDDLLDANTIDALPPVDEVTEDVVADDTTETSDTTEEVVDELTEDVIADEVIENVVDEVTEDVVADDTTETSDTTEEVVDELTEDVIADEVIEDVVDEVTEDV